MARPWEGILIGAVGALFACPGCALLDRLRIDYPVGCVPIHLFASVWGLLAVALFAEKDIVDDNLSKEFQEFRVGIFKGGPWRFAGVQALAIVAVSVWTAIVTFLELLLVDKLVGMRVSPQEELLSADNVQHGIERSCSQSVCACQSVNSLINKKGPEPISCETERHFQRLPIPLSPSGSFSFPVHHRVALLDIMTERQSGGFCTGDIVHPVEPSQSLGNLNCSLV